MAERAGCIPHVIDVLVNNTGVDHPRGLLAAESQDIDLHVSVQLSAALRLCRLFVPPMVARDRGHVANSSCIAVAITAARAVNIGHMEITPTLQVPGGLSTVRLGEHAK